MPSGIPTVRQRELGTRLRRLRTARGLTVEDVAKKLLCTPSKVSRMETSQRRPTLRDVRDLCELYEVDDSAAAELMEIARKAREVGWWTEFRDLDLPYVGLEEEASAITTFTTYYAPGLLQTADYASQIIKAIAPQIDPDIHQQRVMARMVRQEKVLARENPPRYRVIMDEAVLLRVVGGPATMIEQLDKILDAESKGTAAVQIVPLRHGAHASQDSNFVLLEFTASGLPSVVFVESLVNHQYLERKADIDRYRETIDNLRDSALSSRDSVKLITDCKDTYMKQLQTQSR